MLRPRWTRCLLTLLTLSLAVPQAMAANTSDGAAAPVAPAGTACAQPLQWMMSNPCAVDLSKPEEWFWFDPETSVQSAAIVQTAGKDGQAGEVTSVEPPSATALLCRMDGAGGSAATCLGYFQFCYATSQCCPGLICRRHSNVARPQCLYCENGFAYCERDSDCCPGLICRRNSNIGSQRCQRCASTYAYCDINADCCSGNCIDNRCR